MDFAVSDWVIGCIVAIALQTLRLDGRNFAEAATLTLSDLPKLLQLTFGAEEQSLKTLVIRGTNLTEFVVAEKTLDALETLRVESSPLRAILLQRRSLTNIKSVTIQSEK